MREPELLFQRQRLDDFVILWDGRAGHYLNGDLNAHAQRFPTRPASDSDYVRVSHARTREASERIARQVLRDQRIARGLCPQCPNRLSGLELKCASCRRKESAVRQGRRSEPTA